MSFHKKLSKKTIEMIFHSSERTNDKQFLVAILLDELQFEKIESKGHNISKNKINKDLFCFCNGKYYIVLHCHSFL